MVDREAGHKVVVVESVHMVMEGECDHRAGEEEDGHRAGEEGGHKVVEEGSDDHNHHIIQGINWYWKLRPAML